MLTIRTEITADFLAASSFFALVACSSHKFHLPADPPAFCYISRWVGRNGESASENVDKLYIPSHAG